MEWTCVPPTWLLHADPARYVTQGQVLVVADQGHRFEVECRGGRWLVRLDGAEGPAVEDFVSFLWTLAGDGQALVELSDVEYSTPEVRTTLGPGFASDLLWWLTESYGGEVVINGDEWGEHLLGAPAPYAPGAESATPWSVDCIVRWLMPARAGYVGGPGSDYSGTAFAGRIGSRAGIWVSDPGEFVREQSWATVADIARLVGEEARDGGALAAWPATVQAPDPSVASAVRRSLRYPSYWLNEELILDPGSAAAGRAASPSIPAPEGEWTVQLGGLRGSAGSSTQLRVSPGAADGDPVLPDGEPWMLAVDREWFVRNDPDTLALLCLACDQQTGVGYGSLEQAGRVLDTIEAPRMVVLQLARAFGLGPPLVVLGSPVPGASVRACDLDGRAQWSGAIREVRSVRRREPELASRGYDLELL